MVNLALWLKENRFRLDQVQNFYPSPSANAATMYYSGKNPLGKVNYKGKDVVVPRGERQRRLHKALLRYHDPANWPLIRDALNAMGMKRLTGNRPECLIPAEAPGERATPRVGAKSASFRRPALTRFTTPTAARNSSGKPDASGRPAKAENGKAGKKSGRRKPVP